MMNLANELETMAAQSPAAAITVLNLELQARGERVINVDVAFPDLPIGAILSTVMFGCDGAVTRDGTGFNRNDLRRGVNDLVDWLQDDSRISLNGAEWALSMCVFYQRQWICAFPAGTLEAVKASQAKLEKLFCHRV